MNDAIFTVDHMLIKLGKYLRIMGYDAIWDTSIRTHELILKANAEGRIFLTRNSRIPDQYPQPARSIFIKSTDPVRQMEEVITQAGLEPGKEIFSRCIRCNIRLELVADKQTIAGKVHPNVLARFEQFFTCSSCGTVFWLGSHVRNTCRKLQLKDISQLR